MATLSRTALKNIFITGAKPTQQNFRDVLDSYWHVNDGIATQSWVTDNFSPVSGNDHYIRSQQAIAQPADFWVNTGRFSGAVTIGSATADPAYIAGSGILRSDLNKIRWGIDGSYHNMATEDWVQAIAITNQKTVNQVADFRINGTGLFKDVDPNLPFYTSISSRGIIASGSNTFSDFDALTIRRSYPNYSRIFFENGLDVMNPSFALTLKNGNPSNLAVETNYGTGWKDMLRFDLNGVSIPNSGIATAAPSPNGAAFWNLGNVLNGPIAVDLNRYVEVKIGAQIVKLLVAQ